MKTSNLLFPAFNFSAYGAYALFLDNISPIGNAALLGAAGLFGSLTGAVCSKYIVGGLVKAWLRKRPLDVHLNSGKLHAAMFIGTIGICLGSGITGYVLAKHLAL